MVRYRLVRAILRLFAVVGVAATVGAYVHADALQWRWSNVDRIVAVGDVHGAYDELVGLLQATHVVDASLAWSGGGTHLVSLGDLIDRGPQSRQVLDLVMKLQQQAPQTGGAVHVVLGNHELMNLTDDLRYVVPADFAAFAGDETAAVRALAFARYTAAQAVDSETAQRAFDAAYPAGYFARRAAFSATGVYGRWLIAQPVAIVIDGYAFLHGGLAPVVADAGLDELNQRFRSGLDDMLAIEAELNAAGYAAADARALVHQSDQPADAAADPSRAADRAALVARARQFEALNAAPLFSDAGPLWYRGTALCHRLLEQGRVERGLTALGANVAVLGHTPTDDRRVDQRFDGKVVLLDTGMLASYYHGHPAALVIEGGHLRVVYGDGGASDVIEPADSVGVGRSRDQLEQLLIAASIAESRKAAGKGRAQLALELRDAQRLVPATFTALGTKEIASELAAYRLDVLLGLDLVPVTARRSIDGARGIIAAAPDRMITEADRREAREVRPNWCAEGNDYQLMYAFDALVGNDRRSAADISYDRNTWQLRLTGNTRAFPTSRAPALLPAGVEPILPREFAQRLAGLDTERLRSALGDLLSKAQLDAILARRDAILANWKQAD